MSAKGLWVTSNGVGLSKVLGGVIEVNKDNGGRCMIEPPANENCSFRQAKVCVNGEEKTAYILMSDPK